MLATMAAELVMVMVRIRRVHRPGWKNGRHEATSKQPPYQSARVVTALTAACVLRPSPDMLSMIMNAKKHVA